MVIIGDLFYWEIAQAFTVQDLKCEGRNEGSNVREVLISF